MKKPKFIKEIEKSEWKERAKCWRWYIRVYWELDHKPMVELESLEIIVKELHKLEEENKKLKKECEENDYLVEDNARWMKKCEEKTMEIKKLKSDLWECECSLWFESDEVWFWKWEYKRLKKWIKDHCKWYWNLFPEDEMKRQWKKADKKRKLKWMLMEEDTLQELKDIWEL